MTRTDMEADLRADDAPAQVVFDASSLARFERYVREDGQSLVRFAAFVSGDISRAEDLAATALAATWERLRSHRVDNPAGYARTCILHASRRQGRRRALLRTILGRVRVDDHSEEPNVDRVLLDAALQSLTPQQRAVVAMRYLDDQPIEVVAHVLGMPAGTVKSTSSRALEVLRNRLTDQEKR